MNKKKKYKEILFRTTELLFKMDTASLAISTATEFRFNNTALDFMWLNYRT